MLVPRRGLVRTPQATSTLSIRPRAFRWGRRSTTSRCSHSTCCASRRSLASIKIRTTASRCMLVSLRWARPSSRLSVKCSVWYLIIPPRSRESDPLPWLWACRYRRSTDSPGTSCTFQNLRQPLPDGNRCTPGRGSSCWGSRTPGRCRRQRRYGSRRVSAAPHTACRSWCWFSVLVLPCLGSLVLPNSKPD